MTEMKRIVALALSLVVIIGIGVVCVQAAGQEKQEKKVQTVKLTVADHAYVVTPSTVTKGVPVKMEADLESVKGCARTVVISAFNVKKTVKKDDVVIEFTPDKAGSIDIKCGMNTVKGSFTVAEQ